jgi:hypothetical protein
MHRTSTRGLAIIAASVACASALASVPAQAAQPSALSAACRALQHKAIVAESADPVGQGTKQTAAYLKKCPGAPYPDIRSIGDLSTFTTLLDAKHNPVGVKQVTSSNPKVILLGPARETTADGVATTEYAQMAVGLGNSTVCIIPRSGKTLCELVVVPKAISGKKNGRTLNVSQGGREGDPAKAVTITSSNPAVITAVTDAMGLPSIVVGQPGTTTVCATFTKGPGGCQDWTLAP